MSSVVVAHRLSSCGSRAQLLRGIWDLPGPGLKPVSPALAGGFLTPVPPEKPKGMKVFLTLFKSKFGWHEANFPCCLLHFQTFTIYLLNVNSLVG